MKLIMALLFVENLYVKDIQAIVFSFLFGVFVDDSNSILNYFFMIYILTKVLCDFNIAILILF